MANDYKYDVAISFLDLDEPAAKNISESLNQGLKSFVFSERQAELGGNDGVEAFTDVFGRDARIIVVLYREQWGKTKWTRIEETAIKDRLLNDGAEFLTFVHLEKDKAVPRWLPQSRLWLDFDRLGVQGTVAVIEERVARAGAAVREETVEENASRLRLEQEAAARRIVFLHSQDGVKAADTEADALFARLEALRPNADCDLKVSDYTASLFRNGYAVYVSWSRYRNTLEKSQLTIQTWNGRPSFGPYRFANLFQDPEKLSELTFDFERLPDGSFAWCERSTRRLCTSERLADEAAKLLLELVRAKPNQDSR